MSVLNVYPADLDTERRHYRSSISVPDHRIASLYRRFSWSHHQPSSTSSYYDTFSSSSSSSRNSSLEVIFSRLLDVLIFTSAMAITAYNYLTGTLDVSSSHFIVESPMKPNTLDYYKRYNNKRGGEITILHDPIEESRRQRTQQWAEQQLYPHHHHHHHQKKRNSAPAALDKKVHQSPKSNSRREKKRTHSLPDKPAEKEEEDDDMFARMEERLQSLIEQGQAALTSQIDFDDQIVSNRKR